MEVAYQEMRWIPLPDSTWSLAKSFNLLAYGVELKGGSEIFNHSYITLY